MAITRPMQKSAPSQVDDSAVLDLLKDVGFSLRNAQYKVAASLLASILKHLPSVKSKNVALMNAVTSLQEGLASRDITKKEFDRSIREEFAAYDLFIRDVLKELRIPTQKEEMISLEELVSHQRNVLTGFEETRDSLEKKILASSGGVLLTTAPTILVTNPGLDVAKLKANGFKSESFMGYPIVHKMIVLGITTERIVNEVRRANGKSSKPTTAEQRNEVIDRVVDIAKARMPDHRLIPVGGLQQWYEASWLLLMPQAQVNRMKSCTMSPTTVSSLIFKKWAFPFASKV